MIIPKIMQQTFRTENGIGKQSLPIKMIFVNWTLMGVLLFLQINTFDAAKYKGDGCQTKSQAGVCKEWSECPEIKDLIDRGEYTNREVVTCGFGVREELICCPQLKADIETGKSDDNDTDRFVILTTTTPVPERDFWLDLLENLNKTSSTTAAPDFWQDLLTTTTTTTRPLMVGEQRLNESSEFFDFNALLSGTQKRQTIAGGLHTQNTDFANPNNQRNPNAQNVGFISPGNKKNNNGLVNLNSGPVNLNQWNFEQSSNNQRGNNGRGQQNNGFNGRGQQNGFRGNNGNNNGNAGRGSNRNFELNNNNNPNRGFIFPESTNNGNAGRGSNRNFGLNNNNNNQNRGFIFAENKNNNGQIHRSQRPVNNMNEQNPNRPSTNKNDNQHVNKLIKDIFDTTSGNYQNPTEQYKPSEQQNVDTLITNIFDTPKTQNTLQNPTSFLEQNVNKPQFQEFPNNQRDFINSHTEQNPSSFLEQNVNKPQFQEFPNNQRDFINSHQQNEPLSHYNEFEREPSTNFIRQPVVVETCPHNPTNTPQFDPIQHVYQNLVNSGMEIVKLEADHVQNNWNQQQQQFGNHPQFVNHPQAQLPVPQVGQLIQQQQQQQQPLQQFVQQPNTNHFGQQQFVAQPQTGQPMSPQFGQQPLQSDEPTPKEPRAAQQPSFGRIPNIQSPPINILDPFKPFEFRPSPEDEVDNSLSPTKKTTIKPNTDRPAVRACNRIEQGLIAGLSDHILGGTPVELGELPHMAGIGYSRIGSEGRPPYDIRCGGTLIDKRFVLTAAHCVSDRSNVPSIVRLGVVNNNAGDHMKNAVELKIKETFIHDAYSTSATYNDIAILELEREVQTNDIIYPVCLHSDVKDPDTEIKLWVSGWGTINTSTRSFSNLLLKAPLHTAPLEQCNQSYVEYGLTRGIKDGVRRTQICAADKDQLKDSCQGDSGGPLHLVVDESLKNYRLVGVVSTGFSCGSTTPGLYTRVAAFLDFIEKIVWPNGGD